MKAVLFIILSLLSLTGCVALPEFSGSLKGGDGTSISIKHKKATGQTTTTVAP